MTGCLLGDDGLHSILKVIQNNSYIFKNLQLINLNANRITLESANYLKTFLHNYNNVGIQNNMSKTYSSK